MKWLIAVLVGLVAIPLFAQSVRPTSEVVDSFKWPDDAVYPLNNSSARVFAKNDGFLNIPSGQAGQWQWVSVGHEKDEPLQLTLRTLGPGIASKITSSHYAIVGKMSYSGVAPNSYLEMWSYFAPPTSGGPEGAYFSRTLADGGPMSKIEGTADEQDFELPFDAAGAKTKLVRLAFNLHLTGAGSVNLWDVKLVQYPSTPGATVSAATAAPPLAQVPTETTDPTLYAGFDASNKPVWNLAKTDYPSLDALQAALKNNPITQLDIHPDQRVSKNDFIALLQACSHGGVQTFSVNGGPASPIADYLNALPPKSLSDFVMGNPENKQDQPNRIILDLTQGDGSEIRMGGATYTATTLPDAVKKDITTNPQTAFVIRGNKSIPYKSIRAVLDALREAGASNVFFATDPTLSDAHPALAATAAPEPVASSETASDWAQLVIAPDPMDGPEALAWIFKSHQYKSLDTLRAALAKDGAPRRLSLILSPVISDKVITDTVAACADAGVHQFGFDEGPPLTVNAKSSSSISQLLAGRPGHAPLQNQNLDVNWPSYIFGVISTLAAILLAWGLFLLARQFRTLRHARELRRIASLDG